MKFIYTNWLDERNFTVPNSFYLFGDDWDDYHYKTTFLLYYVSTDQKIIQIGKVKILHINHLVTKQIFTKSTEEFERFDNSFVSLGQNEEYYKNIGSLEKSLREELLINIRDWSTLTKDEQVQLKDNEGFNLSLLREWDAAYILDKIPELLKKQDSPQNLKFIYSTLLPGASKEHVIDFDFTKNELPYRIFILVGKNGVGKTKVIDNLISDFSYTNYFRFPKNLPDFNQLISFYYGEDIHKESLTFESDKVKQINIKENLQNHHIFLDKIYEKKRFLYAKQIFRDMGLSEYLDFNLIPYSDLSSGQQIIYKLVLNILAYIEDFSLIIIDEPEVHLHPNMLAKVMTILRKTLNTFKSYAIMSTHSSLVLQQIPARSVRLISRTGNTPLIQHLDQECFGETLSTITQQIFGVNDSEAEYKTIFKEMKQNGKKLDDIYRLFGDKLSFNAKVFLINLYNQEVRYEKI